MLNPVARKLCVQVGMKFSTEVCPYAIWLNNHGIIDLVAVASGNSSVFSVRYFTTRLVVSEEVRSIHHSGTPGTKGCNLCWLRELL
jgi:hypothetical protein